MPLKGKEIHRGYDGYGAVRVLDDGVKRYLAFSGEDEQSCLLKDAPQVPQHEYIRAMLSVLLFTKPNTVISLGLGGGALNRSLYHMLPELQQQIVELRPEVVKVAYKYFGLPRTVSIDVTNQDAVEFLQQENSAVDVIFSDIYSEHGLDEVQLSPAFLNDCCYTLKDEGWLVLNCWKEHRGGQTLELLKEMFSDVRGCTTQSGNWVILAGMKKDTQSAQQLKERAKTLGEALGFSMSKVLSGLDQYTHR